jgi:hypothetical protein
MNGLVLSDREGDIEKEAASAIKVLEEDGTVIAFLEVFKQVRADVGIVEKRLGKTDTGNVTQAIETDIIDTLKEMIEALKKAQKPEPCTKCDPPEDPGDPGPRPDKEPLVTLLQELKMVRAMQNRVNTRTKTYGAMYKGEQAETPDVVRELKILAEWQLKVHEITTGFKKTQER